MRLARFQDEFAAALLAPAAAEDLSVLASQPGFAVYRNTVLKGCIDALRANYPSVARLVGDEWFRAAAAVYARVNLPRRPMLFDYGGNFADFLARFAPAAELPYLTDVARLDRFWTEAHVARDETPVSAAAVANLSREEMARTALQPHASARWAWFAERPAYAIWQRNRVALDEAAATETPIEWRGEGALLVRPYASVEHFALDAAGCAFLDACAAGRDLASAALAALACEPRADLARLMQRLLEAGAFGAMAALGHGPGERTR
jgi:hypothetical protein